jgi:hypothetical protein
MVRVVVDDRHAGDIAKALETTVDSAKLEKSRTMASV